MDWQAPPKPAETAENRLLEGILSGHFPIGSNLPGERDLAAKLGVTRPTLREAFQRLARDGWISIQHGKPTRVNDYWREGNLGVLAALARFPDSSAPDFVVHLLELRVLIAPAYARQAVAASGPEFSSFLEGYAGLEDDAGAFAHADWELHRWMTRHADNAIFRLLLNSFQDLYLLMGRRYFEFPACRRHSRRFYGDLLVCARGGAAADAEELTKKIMEESLKLWKKQQKEAA